MFKKSRRKIVAAIMSILVLLWVGTLGVIYAFSYLEMSNDNEQMLKTHAQMYELSQPSEMIPPSVRPGSEDKHGGKSSFSDSHVFQLSRFFTVALSYDGKVLEVKSDIPSIHSNEKLIKLACHVSEKQSDYGVEGHFSFYRMDKGGYILITFMDNTVVYESAMTLFRYTLIIGSVALVLFFFLARFLAKKIVAPLEESYQKQRQFISDAGHELKTPVSVVSANAELLARQIGDNQWLQNIQYENERMGMLVGQLLDLARTESVTPQMEHIDFSRLVAGETLPFESVAFEKGLVLSSDIASGIVVEGNSSQLKQLTSILLDNAIRHSKADGQVRLTLTKDHGAAQLSVVNHGDEIPSEHREQIFERFYRVDPARNGADKHYGLGLAIAKAIVNAHHGHIEVLCYNGLVEFRVNLPMSKGK